MKRAAIREHGVYIASDIASWRRVVACYGRHVVYSTGTDRNRVCLLKTFARWARMEIRQVEGEDWVRIV